jgi:methyl-accepting chemotaxis protein
MTLVSHLRLGTKMTFLLCIFALGTIAIAGIGAVTLHQRMLDDRLDKLEAMVSSTAAVAAGFETRVAAGEISRQQALELFGRQIHAIRYDHGIGYMAVTDAHNGNVLMHGVNQALEGKPTPHDAATGQPISVLLLEAVRTSNEGVASYLFPKPGQTEPLRKLTAVAKFPPWDIVIYTGAYTDDLDDAFHASLLQTGVVGGSVLLLTLLAGWLISRDITASLGGLKTAMDRLARGDLTTAVPGTIRRDEVGEMAAAVLVFKQNMTETERLRAEQDAARQRAEAANKTNLEHLANGFETKIAHLVGTLSTRSTELATAARSVTDTADQSNQQAASVAAAAEQASAGLHTVASAAEQLTASIGEITRQVAQSPKIAHAAVDDTRRTDAIVRALAAGAERIGAVVGLITP